MTIERARKILGKTGEKMSDEEVQKTIDFLSMLVNKVLDSWEKMTPEERDKWKTKKRIDTTT